MRSFLARAALVALVPTALVGVSPATAASAYHVTLSSSRVSLDYGQSLLLHGRVTGGPVRGRAVVLFFTRASQPDTWHRIGTASLSARGFYQRRYAPRFGGDIRFRAVRARVGGHAQGVGASGVSEVYQWQGIWRYWNGGAGSIGGPGGATVRRGTANVAGTSYPGSLIANDGTEANFTSFQCKAVRGLVGVTHGSSEPTGLLGFDNEGNYVAQVGASRTHTPVSMRADLDPADGLSLHALIGSTDGTAGGTTNAMVLARPQVLCDAPA